MVVILKLMPHCCDHHLGRAHHLEQRHTARAAERDDEFAQERALPGLAAGEGRCLQRCEPGANGDDGLLGELQVPSTPRKLAFGHELEQSLQINLGRPREANAEGRRRMVGLRARAASSLRCNASTNASASA